MKIYVGNLAYGATEADLQQAFEAFGQVESVAVVKDKFSGESRGFGFVEMPGAEEAQAAIAGLNGKDLKERTLNVSEARPPREGRQGGSRDGGGGSRGPQRGGRPGGGRPGGDRPGGGRQQRW